MIFREADDRDLVLGARKGRVEAYNTLVSRWEKKIYNYLLRLVGSPEDAMDVCQDVFLKAYQSLGRLDDAARFGPWLYRIAHNEAYSALRKRRPESEMPDAAAADPASLRRMAPIEVSLAVGAALDRLPAEQREAVLLKVCEGFKFEEIAAILDCPASTVKSRVYTGLESMKETLAPVQNG